MTGESVHTIKVSGEFGLRQAPNFAETLRRDLSGHSNIAVVFDDVTAIDITILQLLIAARRSALASGKTLSLQIPTDGPLPTLLRRAGFVDGDGMPVTPEGDFWRLRQPA